MSLNTLEDLLKDQLQDLYSAETQLVKALPKMAESSKCDRLKSAFNNHLEETKGHVSRLEQIGRELNFKPTGKTCKAMKGLVEEGGEAINTAAHPSVHDANLIAAAQRVEHYEIAAYGTARELAESLGHAHVASLLEMTLDEEKRADSTLTDRCREIVNKAPEDQADIDNAPEDVKNDENRDPITGEHGSHPVGTGVGAAAGGIAAGAATGAAIGTAGGPMGSLIGAGVGAVAGAVAGGYAGKAAAEEINPTVEHNYWRQTFSSRPYARAEDSYETYAPAYQYGWEAYSHNRNKKYSEVEGELERGWSKVKGNSKLGWDRARNAVRDSWDKLAGEKSSSRRR